MGTSLIEHHEMDPVVLAVELDAAWYAAQRHDAELARLKRELASLRRRYRRLYVAFGPLRRAVGTKKAESEIAAAAIDAVRGYHRAIAATSQGES